jgi:hypothetical protein
MEMASFCLKIRHVFADTSLTERRIGAGPPLIIQLSARVAVRKTCWYYFLPNSKRAVSIMSFYGHRRVSSHKPLVIVRSLVPNIYKFWIRIAFNGVYQRYNSYTMVNLCEDSAWIWIMNMNIKIFKVPMTRNFTPKVYGCIVKIT